MSLLRGKDKARRKAEHELMETTLGMLHGQNDGPSPPQNSPHATATLPSNWHPTHQQQRPRPDHVDGGKLQRGARPPPLGFRNGTANNPRGYNSLSSSARDSTPSPLSQRSAYSFSPSSPRSPDSFNSINSQQKRFGTWAPSAPMSPQPVPATLSVSPQPRAQTRTSSPIVSSGLPPNPVPQPAANKPQLDAFRKEKPDKAKKPVKDKKKPPGYKQINSRGDGGYYEEETWAQRHKCLVVCLAIIFILCFIIAIIVFAIGASGVFGKFFRSEVAVGPPVDDNCTYVCENNSTYSRSPLVVIALDGFRYSYLEMYEKELPNLNTLANCGVKAQMLASFPATTSPNLWTIVSGYYPQFHGIVSDWIRDYETGEEFEYRVDPEGPGTRDAGWFHDPALWQIARQQGKITASQQWLGDMLGQVEDDHHLGEFVDRSPTYVDKFDRSRNYTLRMTKIVDWLRLPINKRPELITVYFEDPGTTARKTGAESTEVQFVLEEIDGAIGYLRRELSKDDALGCVNIMIVSTSGLEDIDCSRVYYLTNKFEENVNDFIVSPDYLGSMARVTPKTDAPEELNTPAKFVNNLKCEVNHGEAYLTDFLPYRLHGAYGHHLEETAILMEEGWTFAKQRTGHDPDNCEGANDGYDPFAEKMKGIFLGFGRDFKIGERILPFQNIELFNLMTELINVEPLYHAPPSDGSVGMLYDALKSSPNLPPEKWDLFGPSGEQMCQFPQQRRQETAGCDCTPTDLNEYAGTQGLTFEDMDETLNQNIQGTLQYNAPFGVPGVRDDINPDGEYFCILYQENYITSFDRFLKIPTSVVFTLNSNTRNEDMDMRGTCIRYDQRLDPDISPQCADFTFELDRYHDIILNVLYQPSLAPGVNAVFDSQITSNVVPQYREFAFEIWNRMYDEILSWARSSDQVNIVVGPAYDMNRDSRKDSYYKLAESIIWVGSTPLPTHYYVVATRCQVNGTAVSLRGCKPADIQFISYIFPHVREIPLCFNFNKYLRNNLATLRDVEKLTGLVFFPELSMSRNEEIRLQMVRLKTQYPYGSSWTGL